MSKSKPASIVAGEESGSSEVVQLIAAARQKAFRAVNTTLIDLYWQVGQYNSHRLASTEWGEGTLDRLAQFIARRDPGARGFSRSNLFTGQCQVLCRLMRRSPKWKHCCERCFVSPCSVGE